MLATENLGDCQSSVNYRTVAKSEQMQALDLWKSVFEPKGEGYFERYFSTEASPLYQEGDTLGAWTDGDQLVSVVHIRRIMIKSAANETFLCGVISNVTTLIKFRNRGLSRHLLALAIDKMEKEGFALSILGTGRPSHYLPMGFVPVRTRIQYVIHISNDFDFRADEIRWIPASSISCYDQLLELYSAHPRLYQFDRFSSSMFEHWIGWHWQEDLAFLCLLSDKKGYVIISQPDGKDCDVCVSEWRAVDSDAETTLLNLAAKEIRRRYRRTSFLLHTLPQHPTLFKLGWNSDHLLSEQNEDIMIRNIQLSDQQFQKIKAAYETTDGKAIFWPGEYF